MIPLATVLKFGFSVPLAFFKAYLSAMFLAANTAFGFDVTASLAMTEVAQDHRF